jgi:filamentous hemagglutinin
MASGIAPIGKDGKSVELHHLKQQNNGIIVEVTNTEHLENTQIWHRYTDISEIERKEFDAWRIKYWKERANHLCR